MRVPAVMPPIRNRYFFSADAVLLPLAVYFSFVVRLEALNLAEFWLGFALFAGLSVLITPLVFQRTGIYARYWRYASLDELVLLSAAILLSNLLISSIALIVSAFIPGIIVPRAVPVIYLFLSLAVTALPRLVTRLLWRYALLQQKNQIGQNGKTKVLIMGAGNAGSMMVRELKDNPQLGIEVVGFIDDDLLKRDVRIHGVPVLGSRSDIPRLASEHQIAQVIIAMPSVSGKTIRSIVEFCEQAGVRARSMPGMYEILDGKVSFNQVRDVQIEDLLRRQPVDTNIAAVSELLRGRRVLVTGGGGSIGSEVCRQVLRCAPAELIILGHGENSVFMVEHELRQHLPAETTLTTVIADIRFAERIRAVFAQYQPEIVFHAAAHKHVPLMEANPVEAITNNVIGTRNLLQAALEADVDQFVMISTDKAVNPTSMMGAAKRVAELLVHQAAMRSGKPFVAVRFGNVLGSRGSVVLTFKRQIAAGGPVTVTHPEMVRYFMTIPEATQLVLQAATIGRGGEVFTLDMGEPVKIVDLARDMIELSGLEVGRDIDIAFTGMRPGEKLYEELFIAGEAYERTLHEKIFIACNASQLVPIALDEQIRILELAARREDIHSIMRVLHSLIPSFRNPAFIRYETPAVEQERAVGERAVGELLVSEPPLLARTVGQ